MTVESKDIIMSSFADICKGMINSIPNFTEANCSEFISYNVNNITSTSAPTTPKAPDKCISYCEHSIRMVMNDYKNYYHGYITLIVSLMK